MRMKDYLLSKQDKEDFEERYFGRLLDVREVVKRTSLSRASIYRMMSKGTFPDRVHLFPGRRVAWRESDIALWSCDPGAWAWSDQSADVDGPGDDFEGCPDALSATPARNPFEAK